MQKECVEYGVPYPYFLQEVGQIVELFQSDDEKDDSYEILGLSPSASLAEVKRAYRKMTVQYHPDTAGNADKNTTEKFIEINKAYHTISNTKNQEPDDAVPINTDHSWHYGKTERIAGRINKKVILWMLALILGAVLICALVAQIYSQKVMIATLQRSGSAFVPPAKKSLAGAPTVAMTFAEKMKIADTKEKDQQATRQKESAPALVPAEISSNQPEQKLVKAVIPEEQEKNVALPPQEPVQAPAEETEVKSPVSQLAEAVQKTPAPQPPETKKEISTTKTTKSPVLKRDDPAAQHEPASLESKHIAKNDEPVTVATYDTVKQEIEAQIGVETLPVLVPAEGAEVTSSITQLAEDEKKTPISQPPETKVESSTTKTTKSPVLKKDDSSAQHVAVAIESKHIAKHKEKVEPTYDTVKQEIKAQIVIEQLPEQEPPQVDLSIADDMQQRINTFLAGYCRTYGEKNFVAFSRFFEPNATENGEAFTGVIDTYTDLFKATQNIGLQISLLKWEESPKGQIVLNGRFKIDLVYQNKESVHGQGKIDFLLTDDHGQLLVQKMDYTFDQ
ncbi:MAG: DnaJ domain-containing protein [Proteobacteria bacterium]|nr:DnaJ domain-containing protein [Pseudomonadota bacterium]MBU4027988.1 DnaJ domain-containing protein [Pseudomonadota bacterium]MBU4041459.1 DnaJ domain-containing protein [Pseudomonadota bacterium]MBU4166316.1 DnaJ domain-containing protein [Pseudomonadota bacterium]MCG2745767.1 DnaJ domain-containing protein [Desulfobacteraceae bacterium]